VDVGAWVGIITLALAVPVGVISHVLGHHFLASLEKRRLVKVNATKLQAIRAYQRIKSFHNRTRDRYPYYLMLAGWAAICAVASATCVILIALIKPGIQLIGPVEPVGPLAFVLLLLAVAFALFAVLLMLTLYATARQLDRFEDYKAELEQQWGPIDE
jgi:hypothetical protein